MSGVIDYLMAQLPAVMSAVDPDGLVQEGWWTTVTATMLMVGMENPETALTSDQTRQYLSLGSGRVEEHFLIPAYIDAYVGGNDQSVPRKKVCQIFDGVVDLVRSDLTLGGNLKAGRFCQVTDVVLIGTRDVEEAKNGRRSVLSFKFDCNNVY